MGTLFTLAFFISSSAGSARRPLMSLQPIFLVISKPLVSASFRVATFFIPITEPLEPIAWANSPWHKGEAMSALTDIEPADSPTIVMRLGSPPKAAMLSFIHLMAATWSRKP